MASKELDKVLSIKFCTEDTKRNGHYNELKSLKITQSATERYLIEDKKLSTGHRALEGVS